MYLMFNLQRHHRSAALYNICGFLTSLLLPLSRTRNGAGRSLTVRTTSMFQDCMMAAKCIPPQNDSFSWCEAKNVERFTILRVILAQGPC